MTNEGSKARVITLSDVAPADPKESAKAEKEFRKGYFYAANYVFDLFRDGKLMTDIADYVDGIQPWVYGLDDNYSNRATTPLFVKTDDGD